MVTGWRRAFCTSIPRDRDSKASSDRHCDDDVNVTNNNNNHNHKSPKFGSKFGFFSTSSSNPSTPRLQSQPVTSPSLRCRTTAATTPNSSLPNTPKLHCHVTAHVPPSSPKSPSSFSLLKLRVLSKTRCGICLQSVKAGQGTAIFTAECSHSFHFPCIAGKANAAAQVLVCPVCNASWKELPLLSIHHHGHTRTTATTTASKTLRVYDDDEPLASPTSAARFNPIPEEVDEDNAVNSTEFQGFLASRTPRFVSYGFGGSKSSRIVEVRILPEVAIVAAGRGYETYAAVMKVKVVAESMSLIQRRPPVDLVAVVDVGNAGGEIQTAKRAMRLVASSLGNYDRLSIVAFSSASKRLLPLRRMNAAGKRSAQRIADALIAVSPNGQRISVGDAVKKAVKVLDDRREKNPVGTIVLLSDSAGPITSSTRFSVHAVGIADSEPDAVAKRVARYIRVAAQDLQLQLSLAPGSAPAEISAVYSLSSRPAALGSGLVRLGDFHAEEERELLVEIRVPTCSTGSHHILSVRSTHQDPSSTEVFRSREQPLVVPRPQSVRSSPTIQRLRNLHMATRAVAESRRLIERSDLSGAHHLLTSARALLIQSKSAQAEELVSGLETELGELNRLRSQQRRADEKPEPLTPTSAWRAAERLAKVAIMRKSMNRVSDLHGFENARF